MKKAYLLVNLGTPDEPTTEAVKRYLKEFLMDEEVIDIPLPLRAFLVFGLIAPFRSPKSAHAYQKIWTSEGSPLLTHSLSFMHKLKNSFIDPETLFFACRYGRPSMRSVISEIRERGFDELHVFPLYPQYATSSWLSVEKKLRHECLKLKWQPKTTIQKPYFEDPRYTSSLTKVTKEYLEPKDHLLFSFHSIPVKQCSRPMDKGTCQFTSHCCLRREHPIDLCYRSHCLRTAAAVAAELQLTSSKWSVSFQSRLGRAEWLEPFTINYIETLLDQGVKNLAIICPAFVVDCLETLEEVNIGIREKYFSMGGESFKMIPCVNSDDYWIRSVDSLIRDESSQSPFNLQL